MKGSIISTTYKILERVISKNRIICERAKVYPRLRVL